MRETMTSGNQTEPAETEALYARLRDRIIAEPDVILNDAAVMRALVAANERSMGGNVVDLRGVAMQRLEARLDRLENTHRSVIAAAYDNLAGANQVHRATLALMEPTDFEGFLTVLGEDVPQILRVDRIRLALESHQSDEGDRLARFDRLLSIVRPGFVDACIGGRRDAPTRTVTLRQGEAADARLYGDGHDWIRSEALMRLDLGEGRLPGLLALGSEDPHQFKPGQGTDLLGYFCAIFERALRRWLS